MSCTLPDDGTSTLIYFGWRKYITPEKTVPLTYWDIEVNVPTNKDDFPFPDYEMTFDKETVSSNLTIASVGPQDDGTYLCATSYVPSPTGGNPEEEFRLIVIGTVHTKILMIISLGMLGKRQLSYSRSHKICLSTLYAEDHSYSTIAQLCFTPIPSDSTFFFKSGGQWW